MEGIYRGLVVFFLAALTWIQAAALGSVLPEDALLQNVALGGMGAGILIALLALGSAATRATARPKP